MQIDLASYFISQEVFTTRPCKWYFVERIDGEYDDAAEAEAATKLTSSSPDLGRCEAGQPCPREGFWHTPAKNDSRRFFKAGEIMPETGGDWGTTIWQWDETQNDA